MKNVICSLLCLCLLAVATAPALGQTGAPARFNYQAAARNAAGQPLANQGVNIRFSIAEGSPDGPILYQETHGSTTNGLGLFNLKIGAGQPLPGSNFSQINWAQGSKWLKVEMDASGGSNFLLLGSSEFVSVPYALFAANAKEYTAGNGITISGNVISSAGDPNPNDDVLVSTFAGGDVTGVFSNLQLVPGSVGTTQLDANAVTSDKIANGTIQAADLSQMNANNGDVMKWSQSANAWQPGPDIGGGNGDNWGTQVVSTNNSLTGNGTAGNPVGLAQQGAANGQTLKWNGSNWAPQADNVGTDAQTLSISGQNLSISNGNSVNLPPVVEAQTLSLNGTVLTLSGTNSSVNLPPGPAGPQGQQGAQGAMGVQGPPGQTGATGATGPQGPAGAQGPQGPPGNAGNYSAGAGISLANNVITNTGDADNSPTNELQTLSINGTNLTISGTNSVSLPPGPAGPQGQQGQQGFTGPQGLPGQMGATGATGAMGQQGSTGPQGPVGPQGPPGPTYSAGSGIQISGTTISNTGDGDNSTANELQNLSVSGNTLSISNGNSVTLPGTTYAAGDGLSLSGNTFNSVWSLVNPAQPFIKNNNPDRKVSIGTDQHLATSRLHVVGNDGLMEAAHFESNTMDDFSSVVTAITTGTGTGGSPTAMTAWSVPSGVNIFSDKGKGIGLQATGGSKGISAVQLPNPSSNYSGPLISYQSPYGSTDLNMAGYFSSQSSIGLLAKSTGNHSILASSIGGGANDPAVSFGCGVAGVRTSTSGMAVGVLGVADGTYSNIMNSGIGVMGIGPVNPGMIVYGSRGVYGYGQTGGEFIGQGTGVVGKSLGGESGGVFSNHSDYFATVSASNSGQGTVADFSSSTGNKPVVEIRAYNGAAPNLNLFNSTSIGASGITFSNQNTTNKWALFASPQDNSFGERFMAFQYLSSGTTTDLLSLDGSTSNVGIGPVSMPIPARLYVDGTGIGNTNFTAAFRGNVGINTPASASSPYSVKIGQPNGFGVDLAEALGNYHWEIYVRSDQNGALRFERNGGTNFAYLSSSGVWTNSDRRVKKNWENLPATLASLQKLNPVSYEMASETTGQRHIGFLAQEVRDVFPLLVEENTMHSGEKMLAMDYAGIGVLAVKAIQEQQTQIEVQQAKIESLEARLAKLEALLSERK